MKKHLLFILIMCLIISFLQAQTLQESFEGDVFPPEGWEQTGTGFQQGTSEYSAFHGNKYAYISSGVDTLITPILSIEEGDYFSLQANSGSGSLSILISEDKDTWTLLQELELSYGYENYTIHMGASEVGNKFIALAADAGSYYTVYCDSVNGPQLYVPATDAGISNIDQPSGETATGSNDVIVTLKNYGTDDLTNVDIEWSVDGNAQTTVNWTGTLAQGETEQVSLGSYNFDIEQEYSVSVNTSQPNGTTDGNTDNDSESKTIVAFSPIESPYTEDFDGVSPPDVPNGWNIITSSEYVTCETVSESPYSSPNEVKMDNSFYTDKDIILVSKLIDNYTNKVLKFYARGSGKLAVGTMTDNSDAATFESIDTVSVSSGYDLQQVDFSSYSGAADYVAIKHANESSSQQIFIDDFTWTEKDQNDAAVASIDQPSGIFEAGQEDVLVTLKNNGIADLTEVDIEWEVNGETQTTNSWNGNLATNETEQVNLGSYDFSDGGNFTITANVSDPNGSLDENNTNDTLSTTVYANAPLTVPHTEDFDEVTTPDIPIGWDKIVNSSSGIATVESSTSMASTGNNSIKFYNYDDDAAGLYLVSPPIKAFTGNRLRIHLGGADGGSVSIGTIAGPQDETSYEEVENITIEYDFKEYIIDFSDYTGSNDYIAIKHGNAGTYQNIYADHFVWEAIPILSPDNYDFGYLSINETSETKYFEVANTEDTEMNISAEDITITGTDPDDFNVEVNSDITLAPGETADLPVTFVPATAGKKEALLSVTTDSDDTHEAELFGNGLPENSLIEYFEGDDFPPQDWDKPDNYNWEQKENASIEGNYSAYHSGDEYDILSTPKLNIADGDSLMFVARNSTYGGSLSLKISDDGETWENVEDISVTEEDTEFVVHFDTEHEGEKYLGFEAYNYIYLDCVIGPVIFEEVAEHTVELTSLTGSGSVDVDGQMLSSEGESVTVEEGTEVTITANADTDWSFDSWSADASGETSESFTTTITSDYDIGVTFVEEVVEHLVTFTIADTADAAIEGAEIAIEDESTIITDANGEATIDLADDTYDYTVSADGYEDYSGSVEVSGSGLTEKVVLQELVSEYTVTFSIVDENSEALEGATINIDDTDLNTDAGGEATIELTDGTYDYTVSADGYKDAKGNIEIVDADIIEEVTLTSTSTSIGEIERTEINIYPNPTSGKVYIETEESYGFIKVYNLTGERIESLKIEDSKNQIDLTGKPDGIYLIELGGSMESITEKVIKR